jgi:CRP-like cAMP-binding protein
VPRHVTHALVQSLREVPAFGLLDERALVQLVGASSNLFWAAGSPVFGPGTAAEALYVVLSGAVGVFEPAREGESELELARIDPGDFFGEVSVLMHTAHTKVARAIEDSELMVLPGDSLRQLLDENPDLGHYFRRKVHERLAQYSIVPD